jgi:hypothetical protein
MLHSTRMPGRNCPVGQSQKTDTGPHSGLTRLNSVAAIGRGAPCEAWEAGARTRPI